MSVLTVFRPHVVISSLLWVWTRLGFTIKTEFPSLIYLFKMPAKADRKSIQHNESKFRT